MTSSEPKFIGKRISVVRSKQELTITITQKIERWQEAMLIGWLAAWVFVGCVFLYYTFTSDDGMQRIFFAVLSAIWSYFLFRISKVLLWRLMGRELLRFNQGKLHLKNAIGKMGRTEEFTFHNIFKLGLIRRDSINFMAFMDESFWIIGGDRVGFKYNGRQHGLGKQLSIRDAELLVRVMESALKEYK
ncbi:MAG: hypothetical protein ACKVOR_05275 [Flavobacteriales bacterium]